MKSPRNRIHDAQPLLNLLNDFKQYINDGGTAAPGINRVKKALRCRSCGLYEREHKGIQGLFMPAARHPSVHDEFIMIDEDEKSISRNNVTYFKKTVVFICPACGTYQSAIRQIRFEEHA